MTINDYGRQLTPAELEAGAHREFVGGLWDQLGLLQFTFLQSRGLAPSHRLLDVGCGALRGGVHFIRYLDPGRYFGMDVNASLVEAGRRELAQAGLAEKDARLMVSDDFELDRFGTAFDCAIAVSLFTHLTMNHIVRCLSEVARVLAPDARFYASYFEAPHPAYGAPLAHSPGKVITRYTADPYHYAFDEMREMASFAGLAAGRIGDWGHPRAQRMIEFHLP